MAALHVASVHSNPGKLGNKIIIKIAGKRFMMVFWSTSSGELQQTKSRQKLHLRKWSNLEVKRDGHQF